MKHWKFITVMVLLVGLSGFLYARCTTIVEKKIPIPPSGEALVNPLLAAQRLLTRMGLPATGSGDLGELPPTDHVLILGTDNRYIRESTADDLLDWIERGGHLVVGPHLSGGELNDETHDDPLLLWLGVGVVDLGEPEEEEEQRTAITFDPLGTGHEREVRYFDRVALTWLGNDDDEGGSVYAHLWEGYGEGRFDVVNDTRFMQNDEIGELEHAAFLWDLVRASGPRQGVTLVYDSRTEGLMALLWRRGRLSLIVAGLALAALVWRHLPRFGPLLRRHDPHTRSLMEHVSAAGRFFWRTKRQDILLEDARNAVLQRAQVRRARFAERNRTEQSELLAAGSDFTAQEIEAALFEICPHRRETFTRWIQILENLRRGL